MRGAGVGAASPNRECCAGTPVDVYLGAADEDALRCHAKSQGPKQMDGGRGSHHVSRGGGCPMLQLS
jgi:hypothetical protein